MTIDDSQKAYTYQSLTPPATSQGSFFQATNGILNLGNVKGVALGKAVELPGRAALLRPGDNTALPVPMVQQSACFAITGKQRYIFSVPPPSTSTSFYQAGYGTFVADTSSDGSAWNFEDLHSYALTSYITSVGTENGQNPVAFSATCSGKNGQSIVALSPTASFNNQPIPSFNFHPGGPFEASSASSTWVGFAMPSAAVSPAAVATGSYAGFVYELNDYTSVHTQPVAFAALAGSKTLTGGVYLNDDLTQTPGGEYTITLGTQDPALNGVFPNATFTAYDIHGACSLVELAQGSQSVVHASFDVNGQAICTALGVATVSSFEGKYVIYFTSYDGTPISPNGLASNAYPIHFFLYQQ